MMLALGCIQALRCNSGHCPTGITTHKSDLEARYEIERNAQWIATFLKNMAREVAAITLACGKDDCHALSRDDLRALTPEASAMTGLPMFYSGEIYDPDYAGRTRN